MEIMLIVGVYLTLGVQAWRNHLLMKEIEKPMQLPTILVEPGHVDYDAMARALEASWPTVNITNEIVQELDYDRLAQAIAALPPITVEQHYAAPNIVPTYHEPEQIPAEVMTNNTEYEVNGTKIPVKSFPLK